MLPRTAAVHSLRNDGIRNIIKSKDGNRIALKRIRLQNRNVNLIYGNTRARKVSPLSPSLSKSLSGGLRFSRSFTGLASQDVPSSSPKQSLPDSSYLTTTNAAYIQDMLKSWRNDSSSVHPSWDSYFKSLEKRDNLKYLDDIATYARQKSVKEGLGSDEKVSILDSVRSASGGDKVLEDHLKLSLLIRAYQFQGHELADLDPLKLDNPKPRPELRLETYGFTDEDLDRTFVTSVAGIHTGILEGLNKANRTLREILDILNRAYCQTIGFEFMHNQSREISNWMRRHLELDEPRLVSNEKKKLILDRLMWASKFESFLGLKWNVAKRFSLQGAESLIPGIKALIDRSTDLGVENVVMGMAHRGRLNILANVLRKPLPQIFHEFEHGTGVTKEEYEGWGASGDVKYHLGTGRTRTTSSGKSVHISVLSNPSHLEAVNPVVEGKARCKQYYRKDGDGSKVLSIQIHGDASFPGQGVVYETINMTGLTDYSTGGTIHIVINNQIGFTTEPVNSRSGFYCTDPMKLTGAPIFHVNGDDPEAVVHCMTLAAEFREKFKSDVCVDLVCYRRYGHNEGDEPAFTQPLMYQTIRNNMIPCLDQYKKVLIENGAITEQEVAEMEAHINNTLEQGYKDAETYELKTSDWLESRWKDFKNPSNQDGQIRPTAVSKDVIETVATTLTTVPPTFAVHSRLQTIIEARKRMIFGQTDKNAPESHKKDYDAVDWALAEALAFGSLLLEGKHVRLAGQDSQRGTFSQRHLIWTDQSTNEAYSPLNHLPTSMRVTEPQTIANGQENSERDGTRSRNVEQIHVVNSPLSEYACMGFELGYSIENPNTLVCWEGQFGDFANGAQIMIDQFLSAGENKWFRQSGLTLLLPHGYEGQGPEHSSARLERFLQLSDWDPEMHANRTTEELNQRCNWSVVNCSTPSNYFHVLRRQIHRQYRKPLIVMTPKSLLRHSLCRSAVADFIQAGKDDKPNERSQFRPVIGEEALKIFKKLEPVQLVSNDKIRRVLFCSGKIFYDLYQERQLSGVNDVALIRIEQLAPFPAEVKHFLGLYPNAQIAWAQEEPKNMGAWSYMYFALSSVMQQLNSESTKAKKTAKASKPKQSAPIYIGRPVAASPATDSFSLHETQLKTLLNNALN